MSFLLGCLAFGCGVVPGSVGETLTSSRTHADSPKSSELAVPEVLIRRPPRSSGDLDGDYAGLILAQSSPRFGLCYQIAGGEAIGEGVVYLLLDVHADGRITRITVGHSDIRSIRFETCLRQTLQTLTLPASTLGTVLQTHFVFGAHTFDQGREMMRAYRASRAEVQSQINPSIAVPLTGLRSRVQSCYERTRRNRPWLRGRMVLELTVERDGSVSDAAISDSGLDSLLTQCVLNAVRNLRIEGDYASSATLRYPIILEPGH